MSPEKLKLCRVRAETVIWMSVNRMMLYLVRVSTVI